MGQDDTIEVPMDKNWRSLKQVVEFNNDTIRDVVNLVNGTLNDMLDKAIQEKRISARLAMTNCTICYFLLIGNSSSNLAANLKNQVMCELSSMTRMCRQ